jgi:hypothetical protein
MTQNIMTSALEASGPKKYFFAFSILFDGLAHISAIFPLKMQKNSKIGSPYCIPIEWWKFERMEGIFRAQEAPLFKAVKCSITNGPKFRPHNGNRGIDIQG